MTSVSITKEYFLRDHTGRELASYNSYTNRIQSVNLYGNGMIGQVNVYWDSTFVEDPSGEGEFWNFNRTDERSYFVKDHLGSVRITFSQDSTVILNAQDYYPFGETMRVLPGNPYQNRYKFTEKERDLETGYDYFGARYYDSELGRWLSVDPLADKYPGWSPYNYCMNNPLKYVDQDGNEPITLTTAGVASAGVITIALVGHTYNYVTNPAYRKNYDSFVSSAANVAVKAAEDTWNAVTSLFSSDKNSSGTNQGENSGTEKNSGVKEQAGEISKEIGKNSVTLPDGSRVDLKGKGHTNKATGEKVETPHTHEVEQNTNSSTGKTYTKTKKVPRPTTQEDLDKIKR
jgi:RHS repeat-associated protein